MLKERPCVFHCCAWLGVLSILTLFTISPVAASEGETTDQFAELEVRLLPESGIVIFWGETNQAGVAGYTLMWKTSDEYAWNRVDLGRRPDYVLADYIPDIEYRIKVLIRYTDGSENLFSEEVVFIP